MIMMLFRSVDVDLRTKILDDGQSKIESHSRLILIYYIIIQ